MGCTLLSGPGGDAPQTDEDGFLVQREVVQRAVHRILLICLRVLVASNDLKLCALRRNQRERSCTSRRRLTSALMSDIHMNTPHCRACCHIILPLKCLLTRSSKMSWLPE